MEKIDYTKSHEWMRDRKYIKEFVGLVKLGKNDYVMDAGCGSGYVAAEIRPKVRELLQIDYDWAMLSRNAVAHHTDTLKTSILDLWMIRDNAFDAIFSRSVLHRLEEPEKAYSEFGRILKPKGKLVVTISYLPDKFQDEYKRIMSRKGPRLYLTEAQWRDFFAKNKSMKLVRQGKIKFSINLRQWGLLKEHENASDGFKKYFKLKNGIIECSHLYFVLEKI